MNYLYSFLTWLLTGWAILVAAILLNWLALKLGLLTWYDALALIRTKGMLDAIRTVTPTNYAFLLFIYPLILGAIAYSAHRLMTR